MVYVGSKRRMALYILPVIQKYLDSDPHPRVYIEPFVGGANVINKVVFDNKIGYDVHPQLIALLKHLQKTKGIDLPEDISKKEYVRVCNNRDRLYPDWYIGLVGFCASYGAKYFGGYASSYKKNGKSRVSEMLNNVRKQAPALANIEFKCADFRDIQVPQNSVVYCDTPYRGTTKYKNKSVLAFPYEEFYDWCREVAKHSRVLISEYNMPEDFHVLLEKPTITTLCRDNNAMPRIEKLFTL